MGSIQIIVGWVLSQEIVNSAPVGRERVMPAVIYGLNGGLLSQMVSAAVLTRQGKLKDAFHCHVGHCHNLHHAPRMTRHGAVSPPLVDFPPSSTTRSISLVERPTRSVSSVETRDKE